MAVTDKLRARIEALTGTTTAARLRAVMPEIDRKVRAGVRHEEIIEALEAAGLSVKLNTFRRNLYLYRKRNTGRTASVEPAPDGNPAPTTAGEAGTAASDADADFEAALDPKARDVLADPYLSRRPPIIGKKRKDRE